MSTPDPKLNRTREPHIVFIQSNNLIDTNALLNQAIQKLSQEVREKIILRCDELVHLQVSKEVLESSFSQLLQLIVEGNKSSDKLYLHITCSCENKNETEAIPFGLQRFVIQFHTNITPDAVWMQASEKRINSIASLLHPYGGKLFFTQLKNSGGVLSISLPGK